MANEIQVATRPGKSSYATIWNTTGSVWSTLSSAFVAYSTANLADYVITLTEQGTGSGYYTATFPAAIAEGIYNLAGYTQVGGAPAEGDLLVGTGTIEWTGTSVGFVLPLSEIQQIADELLDRADGIETGYTLRQSLRVILAVLSGKLSGAASTTVSIRDVNDSKDRVVATVDSDGNRSALTVDAT